MSIELDAGHVRYAFDVGSGTRVMTDRLPFPMADNSWHSVSVSRPSLRRHVLIVDGVSSVDMLPDSRSVHFDLPTDDLYVGGADRRLLDQQRLRRKLLTAGAVASSNQQHQQQLPFPLLVGRVKALDGFQGCLASVELSGERWTLTGGRVEIEDQFVDQIIEGCRG
jgi:Laminin G domain